MSGQILLGYLGTVATFLKPFAGALALLIPIVVAGRRWWSERRSRHDTARERIRKMSDAPNIGRLWQHILPWTKDYPDEAPPMGWWASPHTGDHGFTGSCTSHFSMGSTIMLNWFFGDGLSDGRNDDYREGMREVVNLFTEVAVSLSNGDVGSGEIAVYLDPRARDLYKMSRIMIERSRTAAWLRCDALFPEILHGKTRHSACCLDQNQSSRSVRSAFQGQQLHEELIPAYEWNHSWRAIGATCPNAGGGTGLVVGRGGEAATGSSKRQSGKGQDKPSRHDRRNGPRDSVEQTLGSPWVVHETLGDPI